MASGFSEHIEGTDGTSLRPRLPHGPGGHRGEAEGSAVSIRPLAGLGEGQEPGCASGDQADRVTRGQSFMDLGSYFLGFFSAVGLSLVSRQIGESLPWIARRIIERSASPPSTGSGSTSQRMARPSGYAAGRACTTELCVYLSLSRGTSRSETYKPQHSSKRFVSDSVHRLRQNCGPRLREEPSGLEPTKKSLAVP